jgi:hypothetical protein
MYSITGIEREILTIFAMATVLKEGGSIILDRGLSEYFRKKENEERSVITDIIYV